MKAKIIYTEECYKCKREFPVKEETYSLYNESLPPRIVLQANSNLYVLTLNRWTFKFCEDCFKPYIKRQQVLYRQMHKDAYGYYPGA